jgi:hypothetical protein
MAITGIARNNREQQRTSAELEAIIEEFGRAMRNAHKPYIANYKPVCGHDATFPFTVNMDNAWKKYVEWCIKYGKES